MILIYPLTLNPEPYVSKVLHVSQAGAVLRGTQVQAFGRGLVFGERFLGFRFLGFGFRFEGLGLL